MSMEARARRTSRRGIGSVIYAAAALIAATSGAEASSGEGSGHIVFSICAAGGIAAGIFGEGIMRLPPVGRLFVMIVIGMAVLTVTASIVDLEAGGW